MALSLSKAEAEAKGRMVNDLDVAVLANGELAETSASMRRQMSSASAE